MQTLTDHIQNLKGQETEYTSKNLKPDQDVRWCAGCGAYSVLSPVQRLLPELGVPKEKLAFISGIGCSGRFPYYMDTYGFHSIHGRALPIATGLKVARPDLSVWVATGDGDCMSIGGNHFIHACRRNIDLNVMMFNNEVYSLTKGQYSPTSKQGQVTRSSPLGALDEPFNPSALALGSHAGFVARAHDKDRKELQQILERAAKYPGFAFVEIYTNCIIFNDGAFDSFSKKENRAENTVSLKHGQPLVFGENEDKGICLDGFTPKVVNLNEGHYSLNDLIVHDEEDDMLAFILSNMTYKEGLPRPMGIIHAKKRPTYDQLVTEQIANEQAKKGKGSLEELLKGGDYWTVE